MSGGDEEEDVERYLRWIDEHREEIDHYVNRALDYFIAEGIVEETDDGRVRLTPEGMALARERKRRRER
jgi:predicted DNA-binding protein